MKITWQDHESNVVWQSLEEVKEWADMRLPCTTTGQIIYETDKFIVICSEKNGIGEFGIKTLIFKNSIVK